MSGSTKETLQTEWFVLSVSTPCMNFVTTPPDPVTGKTQEREFHDGASVRFKSLLNTLSKPFQTRVETIIKSAGGPDLVPYDDQLPLSSAGPGPVRQALLVLEVEMFDLEICLKEAMTSDVQSKVQEGLRQLVKTSLCGTDDGHPV